MGRSCFSGELLEAKVVTMEEADIVDTVLEHNDTRQLYSLGIGA